MSDDTGWASPSGQNPPQQPPSGPTPPPPGGLPPAPPPPGAYGPPPGWTPPPKPGLVPLAPMGLGTLLGAAFRVLRRNPGPVVGFSLLIHVILAVISIAVTLLITAQALGQYFDVLNTASTTGQLDQSSALSAVSSVLVAFAAGLISAIFTYAGQAILQGIITMEVARGTVGEKLRLSALWARTRGRVGALLGWAGLVILISFVAFSVVVVILVLLFAFGGSAGMTVGIILSIVLPLGGLVLVAWLWTKLSLVPSALVIERLTLGKAVRRSWSLVHGYFWRTFGILLLVSVMLGIAAGIIETPVTLVVELFAFASNPTGVPDTAGASDAVFGITQVVSTIVSALVETVTAIISAAVSALIYLDLRMRKEGLDLQLTRFVDARAAGASNVPDPYLTDDSIGAAGQTPAA